MKLLLRADFWFLLFGLCFFSFCILKDQGTIDVNIQDNYFLFGYTRLGIATLIYHLFFSVIYFSFRKFCNQLLGIIHLISGLPFFLGVFFFIERVFSMTGVPRRYYENSIAETTITTSTIIFAILIASQLFFIFNLILSIIKIVRKKKR
jgi:hypothetical protein